MDLPEEGIQIAPVFAERFSAIEAEQEAADNYYRAAASVYMKTLVRLKGEHKEAWDDLRREYGLDAGKAYSLYPSGILKEREPELIE